MRVLLFWDTQIPGPRPKVRPVPWENPNLSVVPMWLDPTPEITAWLERYGNPVYQFLLDQRGNALRLYREVGQWPEPMEIEEIKTMGGSLCDPIPF